MAFANVAQGRVAHGNSAQAKPGFFKRTYDSLIEARRAQADVEIARVLGSAQKAEMRGPTVTVAPSRTGGPLRKAIAGFGDVLNQAQDLRRVMHARFPLVEN